MGINEIEKGNIGMNKVVSTLSLLGCTVVLAAGCANISSLQTAQTLAPNQGEFVAGGGYFVMPDLNEELSKDSDESVELAFPYAEFMYRRGFFENFDAGLKLTIIGTIAVDGKYRFLNTGAFALATGLGVGYVNIVSESTSDGEATETDSRVIDLSVPLHMSYDVNDAFAFYLSPKYNLRIIDNEVGHLGGATIGVRVGQSAGLYLETSYLVDLEDADAGHILQYNAAFFF